MKTVSPDGSFEVEDDDKVIELTMRQIGVWDSFWGEFKRKTLPGYERNTVVVWETENARLLVFHYFSHPEDRGWIMLAINHPTPEAFNWAEEFARPWKLNLDIAGSWATAQSAQRPSVN